MRHIEGLGAAVLLFAFWVAIAGSLHWQHLLFGVAVIFLVIHANRDLAFSEREIVVFRPGNLVGLAGYLYFLLVDLVKANVQVAGIVLHPRLPIEPHLVLFRTALRGEAPRTLLANSITITPGTLTVDLHEDVLVVHALTKDAAASLPEAAMEQRLVAMERSGGRGS
jgi:multicomponent Na+:H+ antiporter subunit E